MRDTINMAREAGFTEGELSFMTTMFEKFEALVRADERESIIDLVAMYGGPVDLEAAIRARGNT
jgi:hypothetical protein